MGIMTNEELDQLAADIPYLKAWLSAVEKEVKKALEGGAEFDNAALEPTRPTRKWEKDLDVIQLLRKFSPLHTVAPRSPLSPAQAEKTLGKTVFTDHLSQHVVSESSGVKVTFKLRD